MTISPADAAAFEDERSELFSYGFEIYMEGEHERAEELQFRARQYQTACLMFSPLLSHRIMWARHTAAALLELAINEVAVQTVTLKRVQQVATANAVRDQLLDTVPF